MKTKLKAAGIFIGGLGVALIFIAYLIFVIVGSFHFANFVLEFFWVHYVIAGEPLLNAFKSVLMFPVVILLWPIVYVVGFVGCTAPIVYIVGKYCCGGALLAAFLQKS